MARFHDAFEAHLAQSSAVMFFKQAQCNERAARCRRNFALRLHFLQEIQLSARGGYATAVSARPFCATAAHCKELRILHGGA